MIPEFPLPLLLLFLAHLLTVYTLFIMFCGPDLGRWIDKLADWFLS